MKYVLSPSILSADFKMLGEEMRKTEKNGAGYIHFDVMDGLFVPSISFGIPVLASIHNATEQVMDVHLMIQEPIRYIEEFHKAGADIVTIHLEACEDVKATLDKIHACDMKAGLSICPETEVEAIEPYLADVDMILVMSVHPGFGGQKFIPGIVEKTRRLKKMIEEKGSKALIQIDGGVNDKTAPLLVEAGADVLVSGSYIFKAADPIKTIHELKNCK